PHRAAAVTPYAERQWRRIVAYPTKRAIVEAIVAEATKGLFTGDNRDGEPPSITLQNFTSEMFRYGAKALRARLSGLPRAELLRELEASAGYVETLQRYAEQALAQLDRDDREADARASSQRQAELARRRGLQTALLAAARYYRNLSKTAKQAWLAIS